MTDIKKFAQFMTEMASAELFEELGQTHTYGAAPENDHRESFQDKAYAHVDKALEHAEKKGYKINHNDGGALEHKDPHITFHYDGGDDEASSYSVHKGTPASNDKKLNPGKSHRHHMFAGTPDKQE